MSYQRQQFYGCCGVQTVYFVDRRVDPAQLKQAEDASRAEGYGLLLGVVRAGQYSSKVLKDAGWDQLVVSGGRSGTRLLTWGKVLKSPRKSRTKVVEADRVFS